MEKRDKTIYEPEVLPPEPDGRDERARRSMIWAAWKRSWGPLIVGVLIDLVDLATYGPVGLRSGFLLGGLAGYALAAIYELPMRRRVQLALAAGLYCMFPLTERLPLGTILGVLARFQNPGMK